RRPRPRAYGNSAPGGPRPPPAAPPARRPARGSPGQDGHDAAGAPHSPRHDVNTARRITRPAGTRVTTTDNAVPSVNAIGPNTGVLTRHTFATSSSRIHPPV